jgi:undecaprenyl-diphosphatase
MLVATIPIVIFGLVMQGAVEAAFTSILLVGVCLLVTGMALFFADAAARRARYSEVRLVPALVIGLAQAAALLPGISRSGATIATGLFLGIQGEPAARFSFLLSIPAILGAAGLKFYQVVVDGAAGGTDWGGLLIGVLAAGIVGALAIKGLLAIIARGRLRIFGFYCLLLGLSTIIYSFIT